MKGQFEHYVAAPPEAVWPVLSDLEGYAEVAPNLSKAELLEGKGLGMRRRCYDLKGRGWNETCVLWEEGRRYSMEVDTRDYPYPFKAMQGTWWLHPEGGGCRFGMRFDLEPRYGVAGKVMAWIALRTVFPRICRTLLQNWERRIMERYQGAPRQAPA